MWEELESEGLEHFSFGIRKAITYFHLNSWSSKQSSRSIVRLVLEVVTGVCEYLLV